MIYYSAQLFRPKAMDGYEDSALLKKSTAMLSLGGITVVLISFLSCLTFQARASMFGIPTKETVYLSPAIAGRVVINGKPLANLEVTLDISYDKEEVYTTVTDDDGFFSFSEKTKKSRRPNMMFDEVRIRQVITAEYQGKDYLLWYTTLPTTKPHEVITDKLSSLHCDLVNPEKKYYFKCKEYPNVGHTIRSICVVE